MVRAQVHINKKQNKKKTNQKRLQDLTKEKSKDWKKLADQRMSISIIHWEKTWPDLKCHLRTYFVVISAIK